MTYGLWSRGRNFPSLKTALHFRANDTTEMKIRALLFERSADPSGVRKRDFGKPANRNLMTAKLPVRLDVFRMFLFGHDKQADLIASLGEITPDEASNLRSLPPGAVTAGYVLSALFERYDSTGHAIIESLKEPWAGAVRTLWGMQWKEQLVAGLVLRQADKKRPIFTLGEITRSLCVTMFPPRDLTGPTFLSVLKIVAGRVTALKNPRSRLSFLSGLTNHTRDEDGGARVRHYLDLELAALR